MPVIDIVLLGIIGGFSLFGLWFGFVHTFGSLIGTIVGAYLASRYYEPMADWLIGITGWGENTSRVLMFIIAFLLINRLVGFLFWIIDKVFKVITHLPFISSINRLLGFILGAIEGIITIGLVVFFIERFPISEKMMEMIAQSSVASFTSNIASILWPLLPDALKLLQSTVDQVQGKIM